MNKPIFELPPLGVICRNRVIFPDLLGTGARADMANFFRQLSVNLILLGENDSKLRAVETRANARRYIDLFRKHADEIDGVLVCLPNFDLNQQHSSRS